MPPPDGALFFDLVLTDPALESVPLPTTSPSATLVADLTPDMLGALLMLIVPPPADDRPVVDDRCNFVPQVNFDSSSLCLAQCWLIMLQCS
jgi:hypothetical protein